MKSGWSCICCLYLGPLVMPTPLLRQKLLRWNEPVHGHSLVLDALKIQRSGSISALWYIIEVCTHPSRILNNQLNPPSLRSGDDLPRNQKHQNLPESVRVCESVVHCSWLQLIAATCMSRHWDVSALPSWSQTTSAKGHSRLFRRSGPRSIWLPQICHVENAVCY